MLHVISAICGGKFTTFWKNVADPFWFEMVTVTEAHPTTLSSPSDHFPTKRPRAHHRVNPYPGARKQNQTEMSSDHYETSPSIAAVSAPSVPCSMLVVQQQKKLCRQFVDVNAARRGWYFRFSIARFFQRYLHVSRNVVTKPPKNRQVLGPMFQGMDPQVLDAHFHIHGFIQAPFGRKSSQCFQFPLPPKNFSAQSKIMLHIINIFCIF